MDFNTLKDLAKKVGGILVMNGNEPELVVLPYEKYTIEAASIGVQPSLPVHPAPAHQSAPAQATPQPSVPSAPSLDDQVLIDALNKEISALKEEIRQRESTVELGEPREA